MRSISASTRARVRRAEYFEGASAGTAKSASTSVSTIMPEAMETSVALPAAESAAPAVSVSMRESVMPPLAPASAMASVPRRASGAKQLRAPFPWATAARMSMASSHAKRTASSTRVSTTTTPSSVAGSPRLPSAAGSISRGSCMPSTTKMIPFSTNSKVVHTLWACSLVRAVAAVWRWGRRDNMSPAATTAMTAPMCSDFAAR